MVDAHVHHPAAARWFDSLEAPGAARFCRMTQLSLLRLLTTEQVLGEFTLGNNRALQILHQLESDFRVDFLEEPAGIRDTWAEFSGSSHRAPKLWMDAYLAAFAVRSKARLVTLDGAFRKFRGLDLLILPV